MPLTVMTPAASNSASARAFLSRPIPYLFSSPFGQAKVELRAFHAMCSSKIKTSSPFRVLTALLARSITVQRHLDEQVGLSTPRLARLGAGVELLDLDAAARGP